MRETHESPPERFASASFRQRLVDTLTASADFCQETRWFDGAILLESGASACWLRIYCGRVIDCSGEDSPLGSTFSLSGAERAWDELAHGRSLADLMTGGTRAFADAQELARATNLRPPEIAIRGNRLEASRIHEALFALAGAYAAAARR